MFALAYHIRTICEYDRVVLYRVNCKYFIQLYYLTIKINAIFDNIISMEL